MTQSEFIALYQTKLVNSGMAWTQNPESMKNWRKQIRAMFNGGKAFGIDGQLFIETWRELGGKGTPTYKALHAMEVGK